MVVILNIFKLFQITAMVAIVFDNLKPKIDI